MMMREGNLRKMDTELLEGTANYSLPLRDILSPMEAVSINSLIGKQLRLEYKGYINSVLSGEKLKKSFGEGLSYKEFMESPQATPSIIRPELSRIHEGVALRDYDWEMKHHMQPHIVYISLTNSYKVGVTRDSNIPYRWIDQGATQAVRLAEVPYRQLAGLIEVALKPHIADKTHWQKMLKGVIEDSSDILEVRGKMAALIPVDLQTHLSSNREITKIAYPMLQVPQKIRSLKLDTSPVIEKTLTGIKGQYLIFDDDSVLNIRSHAGYRVSISVSESKAGIQQGLF